MAVSRRVGSGGEWGPSRALEVFAGGEAEEGSTVATGIEHEKGVRAGVTREREQDGARARRDSRRGRAGLGELR